MCEEFKATGYVPGGVVVEVSLGDTSRCLCEIKDGSPIQQLVNVRSLSLVPLNINLNGYTSSGKQKLLFSVSNLPVQSMWQDAFTLTATDRANDNEYKINDVVVVKKDTASGSESLTVQAVANRIGRLYRPVNLSINVDVRVFPVESGVPVPAQIKSSD